MSRSLFLIVACFTIAAAGCKKSVPTQATPVVPDDSTNVPPETKKRPIAAQREIAVDLSPYMVRGQIALPEGYKIYRRRSQGSCFIDGGKGFAIEIEKAIAPLAATKEQWLSFNARFVKDEPNVLLAELRGIAPGMYAFEARVTLGDQSFRLQSPTAIPISSEQAERMLRCALSLKQTDAIKESMKREPEAIAALKAAGCKFVDEPAGRTLTIEGAGMSDAALANVGDIAGLSTVVLQPAPKLTAGGLARLASLRGVNSLRLAAITDQSATALTGMKDVRDLAIDSEYLTDAGLAFAAGMTDLQSFDWRNRDDARGAKINGAGLSYLKDLKFLRKAAIFGGAIDDTALENLGTIHSIRSLSLIRVRITDSGLHHLEDLKNLEELTIGDVPIHGSGLGAVAELPKLKVLNLNGCAITDAGLDRLRGAAVEELHLGQTAIGDNGLKVLPSLPALKTLDLHGTKVTDAGLAHLGPVRGLAELNLSGTNVTGSGFAHLQAKPDFEKLVLNDTLVTDGALAELAGCPNLSSLELDDTGVSDAGLDKLQAVKNLRNVAAAGTDVTQAGVTRLKRAIKGISVDWTSPAAEPDPKPITPPIAVDKLPPADPSAIVKKYAGQATTDDDAKGKPVISVSLANKPVTDAELANLRAWKSLRILNLEGCAKITDAALPYIALLPELTKLNLAGTTVKGDGLVHLKGLVELTNLVLPNAPMTVKQVTPLTALKDLERFHALLPLENNAALKFISGFSKLKEFDQLGGRITNRQMGYVARMQDLERLSLTSARLGDRGLSYIKGLENLQELRLIGTAVTDSGLKTLAEMTGLKAIELSGNRVTDAGLFSLNQLTDLERLTITKTPLTDRSLQYIRDCSKLFKLELPGANITDKGLANLADMKLIETIDLSGTRVTDAGLKNFQSWEELRQLTADDTAITGKGFASLKKLERLRRIQLNRCKVDDEGIDGIIQIDQPDELTLVLDGAPITDAGLAKLKTLPNLRTLSLNGAKLLTDKAAGILQSFPVLGDVSLHGSGLSPKAIAELKKKEGLTVHAD